MKRVIVSIACGLAIVAANGCALGPKPCTAEWVDWKTERIINDFARDHTKQIASIRHLGGMFDSGKTDLSGGKGLQVALAAIGGLSLIADFAHDAAPKARDAMSECSTAPKAAQLFASMLRREGVDEKTVKAIQDVGVLLDLDH